MLYERVVEVDERVRADGTVERAPDLDGGARRAARRPTTTASAPSPSSSCTPGAIPTTSSSVAALAREIGFTQVSVSHEVSPLIKLVGRGDTTVVDAYLSPILRRYVDRVANDLGGAGADAPRLMFMQSSGGLTAADLFQGKDAILSGPAGGVVGAVETARLAGFDKVIGFDMGGTSTDVSHYDGDYERAFETEVAGVRMRAPMMRIHTVAAGGGSILHYDAGPLSRSARIRPAPIPARPATAAAARWPSPTPTSWSASCMPELFPAIFGPDRRPAARRRGGRARASPRWPARSATAARRRRSPTASCTSPSRTWRTPSRRSPSQRGYDVTDYALNCFGGAGGQHACLVADALGMKTVLHPSPFRRAVGLRHGPRRHPRQPQPRASSRALSRGEPDAASPTLASELARPTRRGARRHRASPTATSPSSRRAHLRYDGTDTPLPVRFETGALDEMVADLRGRAPQPVRLRLRGQGDRRRKRRGRGDRRRRRRRRAGARRRADGRAGARRRARASTPAAHGTTRRCHLPRGARRRAAAIAGPALIIEPHQTIVVEPGWRAEITARDHLVLTRAVPLPKRAAPSAPRPIRSCWRSSTTSSCRSPSRWA